MTADVICHYIDLHPDTEKAFKAYAPDIILYKGAPDNGGIASHHYAEVVQKHWRGERDLIVIEHDIEIVKDTIPSLESCSEPWCTFSYYLFGSEEIVNGLGCTKIAAELQREVKVPIVPWRIFDVRLAKRLRRLGYKPHVHGTVKHHHDYNDLAPDVLAASQQRIRLLHAQQKVESDKVNLINVDGQDWHYVSVHGYDFAVASSLADYMVADDGNGNQMNVRDLGSPTPSPQQMISVHFGFVCCGGENGQCGKEVKLTPLPNGTMIEKECDHPPEVGFQMGIVG